MLVVTYRDSQPPSYISTSERLSVITRPLKPSVINVNIERTESIERQIAVRCPSKVPFFVFKFLNNATVEQFLIGTVKL